MNRTMLTVVFLWILGYAFAEEAKEEPRPPEPDTPLARGKKLFADTQGDDYPSCAQCHNVLPEDKERKEAKHLGPGGTLYGSARRAGWRNKDTYKDVVAAAEYCAKTWQERKQGLKAAQEADLRAYLESIAGDKALPMRKVERTPKLITEFDGGDAARGEKLVARYCGACHGPDHISFEIKPQQKKKLLVARKVRGYDRKLKFRPQGESMSYYTTDRLPDKDLRDIIAYCGK